MVSPLWKAASDGDLQKVLEILNEPSSVDIELKDHTGITPLIEAVRNGHVEVVKVLLDNGADPANASSQGRPDNYTSDPTILELLHAAEGKATLNGISPSQPVYHNGVQEDSEKRLYAPPPQDGYTYYPTINPSLSTVNDPGAFYHPAPSGDSPNGMGNLPPPEVARLIPCRYFPACRYGAQCIFAHPQAPYFPPGPMPPTQYPPYDPMGHQYLPPYFTSPPFQPPPPPPGHPMSPMSPSSGPPIVHARTPSDVMSPSMAHFNPNGPPPPPAQYGPLSPPAFPHPPPVPISMPPISPLPPMHPHGRHPHAVSQPPSNLYTSTSPVPPFSLHQDAPGLYPLPVPPTNINYPDVANGVRPENPQVENYTSHPNHRENANNHRRGTGRRGSFGARKPPCLFFPAGRCKNGDDCRFPHVLHENGSTSVSSAFPARGGVPRPRPNVNGTNNGLGNIEGRLNTLSVQDENPRHKNGIEGSSRSHSSDAGNRPKFHQGPKHPGNNAHNHKKASALKQHQLQQHQQQHHHQQQQRVPNADDFPVLAGSITPPNRNLGANGFGNGIAGPTAAQVLQAPPPVRKDGSKESSTRGPTPDPVRVNSSKDSKVNAHDPIPENAPTVPEQPVLNGVAKAPVMSFAAVATAGANEISKEVSVSA